MNLSFLNLHSIIYLRDTENEFWIWYGTIWYLILWLYRLLHPGNIPCLADIWIGAGIKIVNSWRMQCKCFIVHAHIDFGFCVGVFWFRFYCSSTGNGINLRELTFDSFIWQCAGLNAHLPQHEYEINQFYCVRVCVLNNL